MTSSEYKRREETVRIAPGSGLPALVRLVERILGLSRVTDVQIASSGVVSYTRYAREDDPGLVTEADLPDVTVHLAVTQGEVLEIFPPDYFNAGAVIGKLFDAAAIDHLFPVAFASGAKSLFHDWYQQCTGLELRRNAVYGLPFYTDPRLSDEGLLLLCGFARESKLVDVRTTYKVILPREMPPVVGEYIQVPLQLTDIADGKDAMVIADEQDR